MKSRRLREFARGLTWIVLAGVLAACSPVVLPSPPSRGPPPPDVPAGFTELAARLRPSVVHISAHKAEGPLWSGQKPGGLATDLREFFDRFFGPRGELDPEEGKGKEEFRREGTGTGFLIGGRGEILTNHHVVEGAGRIRVRLYRGEWLDARLIGADPRTDLALLEIRAKRSLAGAPLGDSAKVRVGEWVVAIGNPFGLEETVTVGILSAKGRILDGSEFSAFLQTDAPIHRGNSGGPLLNLRGEVIGVNTAVVTGAPGIGFAIPINLVRRLLPDLRLFGHVRRGWIGVAIQDVAPELARYFKLSGAGGVLITHVQEKGPAEEAGLRPGDIILSMDGGDLKGTPDFERALERAPINIPTDLRLLRGGKALKVRVTTRELREPPPISTSRTQPGRLAHPPLGLRLQSLTPSFASRMGIDDPAGLVVADVETEGPADRAGIRRGDIIRLINMQAVRSERGVQEILRALKGRQTLFLIQRGDRRFFVLLRRQSGTAKPPKTTGAQQFLGTDTPKGFIPPPPLHPKDTRLKTQNLAEGAYALLSGKPGVDNSGFIIPGATKSLRHVAARPFHCLRYQFGFRVCKLSSPA